MMSSEKQKLSIGLVSPGWPPRTMANGIVSYVGTLARALEQAGVSCHILTEHLSDPTPSEASCVHKIDPANSSLVSKLMWKLDPNGWPHRLFARALLGQAVRLHRQGKLDLLEVEESFGWPRHLAGRCPVPMIVRLHGPWFLNGIANGAPQDKVFVQRDGWEKAGILAAQGITAPSKHVLDATRSHYGLALAEAEVIPNPVESVAPADRWNLQGCDPNRIAFIGRFDRHKGGDVMIDAFEYVLRHRPEARLDLVGPDRGCRDETGREWRIDQYLQQKLKEPDRQKVTVHGFLPGAAAAEIRKRALVTVAPSRYETFGIAAAEAMMAGCPLVVGASGALTELVQDGHNGLTAAPGDARDTGDKILALLGNPNRAADLASRAADDAQARYSPGVVAEQTIAFYRRRVSRVPGLARGEASPAGQRSGQ